MNGGCSCAKITKPIYELVKSGKGIMFYAHRPDDIRQPVEINGRYFAKPSKWVPKVKVRKFVHVTGFNDGTSYVEWDGTNMTSVGTDGSRRPAVHWTLAIVEKWIKEGDLIKEVTP
jgi:hypothetical protein